MDIKKTAIEMLASARDTMPEIPGLSTGCSYVTDFGGRAAGTIVSGFWPSAISATDTTAMKSTEAADDMDSVADAESSQQTCNFKVNGTAVAVAAGAGVAAIAAPLIISGMGFTAGGIAANSCGAYIMSLYGGAVPAGGLLAALQSAGVLGVSTTTIFGVAAAGGGAGYGIKKKLEDQGKED